MIKVIKHIIFPIAFLAISIIAFASENRIENSSDQIVYKIQIVSSYKIQLSIDSLRKVKKLDTPIEVYRQKNYYKYTIYEFNELINAIDTLFLVINKHKVPDAFIVKFVNSSRVSFDSDYDKLLTFREKQNKTDISESSTINPSESIVTSNDSVDKITNINNGNSRPLLIKSDSLSGEKLKHLKNKRKSIVSIIEIWMDKHLPASLLGIGKYLLFLSYSNLVLFMVVLLIGYFVLLSVVLLVVIFTSRIWGNYRKKKTSILKDRYHEIIADYLFKEQNENIVPSVLFKQRSMLRKNILVELIIDLHDSLVGDIANKLRALYINLRLGKVSIAKTKSWKWNIKIKGFQELANMDIENAEYYIKPYLVSRNDELRSEATIAFVRLNKENPFGFLDLIVKYFTDWEQLNVHASVKKYDITIPAFKKWLLLENDAVVIFALKMVIIYKQYDAKNEIVTLISHPNELVRKLAYSAVGELGLSELITYLTKAFQNENHKNKLEILYSIGKTPHENQIDFLKESILLNNDFSIRLVALKTLYNISFSGKRQAEIIVKELKPELDDILLHITDKRI